MSIVWRLMYAVGMTPWDRPVVPGPLRELIEGERRLPAGASLDLGCGTGRNSIYLAKQGWKATGIDFVPSAIKTARKKAAAAGVEPRLLVGDVTRIPELVGADRFSLFFDFGCLHGLTDSQRGAYAAGVNEVAKPEATLLIMAFTTPLRTVTDGLTGDQLTRLLGPGWQLTWSEPVPAEDLDPLMKRTVPVWFRYRRGGEA